MSHKSLEGGGRRVSFWQPPRRPADRRPHTDRDAGVGSHLRGRGRRPGGPSASQSALVLGSDISPELNRWMCGGFFFHHQINILFALYHSSFSFNKLFDPICLHYLIFSYLFFLHHVYAIFRFPWIFVTCCHLGTPSGPPAAGSSVVPQEFLPKPPRWLGVVTNGCWKGQSLPLPRHRRRRFGVFSIPARGVEIPPAPLDVLSL